MYQLDQNRNDLFIHEGEFYQFYNKFPLYNRRAEDWLFLKFCGKEICLQ